jgi:hypothetical protein
MFESYRAHHRINNLQLDFLFGGVEVGGIPFRLCACNLLILGLISANDVIV